MIAGSGGHIESDISNIDIFVNIVIVSEQLRNIDISISKKRKKNTKTLKIHKKGAVEI